ncbi:ubiquinone/menaquinone biosynthesis C-methylase UbiE [Tamaricihabitans halophyticus]|uniref:Ubiquinone/menaquinone biosynthesis C-methylase UbiE n=1 Tax=Tamaricihabitans halophyticus TaxID=1262583 RepID=A0A4R2R5Z2_9PSEU|nr:class I SAM-dependent methyltransferase [Tamaricihabitans halophyticus]TCP57249.1 ubiquinone/menaquinone biosynthesis C-methylase UbiE [Tamaricihabitans halophyticus]
MPVVRDFIDSARISAAARDVDGYLDVLPPDDELAPAARQPRTPAQFAMRNRVVAAIYQRWWRPAGGLLCGLPAPRGEGEQRLANEMLGLPGERLVLDVACGPGNFTRGFAEALTGDGYAIGVDASRPMLSRAVRDNDTERAGYLHADARDLPFADGTFPSVCCFAALYLVPEPFTVLAELVRVLAPDGRLALMTSCLSEQPVVSEMQLLAGKAIGVRMFGRNEISAALREHGLVDIRRRFAGAAQYVSARKPPQDP